jgi:hypothetical protein
LSLFSALILTVVVCGLLILGASYALPTKTDNFTNSNTAVNITGNLVDLASNYNEENLVLDNTN